MEKFGIYGGTFDPVHSGHMQLAGAAQRELGLDRVLFLLAADPPHKTNERLTPFFHRVAMLELVLAPRPTFEVCEIEASLPTPSYTIETIRHLRGMLGKDCSMYFLIGGDSFADLPNWKSFAELLQMVSLVVAGREGVSEYMQTEATLSLGLQYDTNHQQWRSSAGYKDIFFLDSIPDDISSTEIRERLQSGERALSCLDPKVVQYIERHRLYSGAASFRFT